MAQLGLRGVQACFCRRIATPAVRAQPVKSPLRSQFLGAPMASLRAAFCGMSLNLDGPSTAQRRRSLRVEANSKTGIGLTKRGTRRARTRTSGFRARMRTPSGRLVLKARRKKGRKVLCTASNFRK